MQTIWKKHNLYRSWHKAPPLVWNDTLQRDAQAWVNRCVFEHDPDRRWGENLYMVSGSVPTQPSQALADAVDAWYAEGKDYTFGSSVYNHFTQVVWRSTHEIGCAYQVCPGNRVIVACKYKPHGNVAGAFDTNVFPRTPAPPPA